jgi:homogentisate 1,2-dioxygenase
VKHEAWKREAESGWISNFTGDKVLATPEQLRWGPQKPCSGDVLFCHGIETMMGAGSPDLKNGMAISRFQFTADMSSAKVAMYSSDADMLIVPQMGVLLVTTEMGLLRVAQKEILVVPRGVKFAVDKEGEMCRGWICETFTGHFVIPDLGPIGSNGLANERDF